MGQKLTKQGFELLKAIMFACGARYDGPEVPKLQEISLKLIDFLDPYQSEVVMSYVEAGDKFASIPLDAALNSLDPFILAVAVYSLVAQEQLEQIDQIQQLEEI